MRGNQFNCGHVFAGSIVSVSFTRPACSKMKTLPN